MSLGLDVDIIIISSRLTDFRKRSLSENILLKSVTLSMVVADCDVNKFTERKQFLFFDIRRI
jgi:hypothetical protein